MSIVIYNYKERQRYSSNVNASRAEPLNLAEEWLRTRWVYFSSAWGV